MPALAAIALAAAGLALLWACTAGYAAAREQTCRGYDARRAGAMAAWAQRRRATLLVDSVLPSACHGVRAAMSCRRLAKRGRPALMIRAINDEARHEARAERG